MERRRLAVLLAGLVLVGGAVTVLRLVGGTPNLDASPPPPPLPTVIKPYSADGVLAPDAGSAPAAPDHVTVRSGPRRLQLSWTAPVGASGYDVRWGDQDRLVAEPDVELDGLPAGRDVSVDVRSVDSFGQRSAPATVHGRPSGDAPAGADNAFTDHFTGASVPDPRLWRLSSVNSCASASKGPDGRLLLLSECARSSVTLRSRTPLRLNRSATELGRFTIDTDAPGESGELDVDLVPGAVAMIDGSPNDPLLPSQPNAAVEDDNLPPGTVRVRIGAAADPTTGVPADTVQVAVGQGVPTVAPLTEPVHAIPAPNSGLSVRWDVVLRTDGVQVLRDGQYVGGANVVPAWSQATPLVEFGSDAQAQQSFDIGMIGLGGAPTSASPVAVSPLLVSDNTVVTGDTTATPRTSEPDDGTVFLTVVAQPFTPGESLAVNGAPPVFAIRIRDQTFATTPAVAGTQLLPGVRYSLVAHVPVGLLTPNAVAVQVIAQVPQFYPAALGVQGVDVDAPPDAGPHSQPRGPQITPLPPQLGVLTAKVLDASGNQVPPGAPLPRGRAVLDVTMDSAAGQRYGNSLAGLAGLTVWQDDTEMVAVPTAMAGPAVGGEWRIAFATSDGTKGTHSIDIRAYGAVRGVSFGETYASYVLGP